LKCNLVIGFSPKNDIFENPLFKYTMTHHYRQRYYFKTFGFGTQPAMGPKVFLGAGQIFSDWFEHLETRLDCISLKTDENDYIN
jgi:hypothetical protein